MQGIYIHTSGTVAVVKDDFTYGQLTSLVGGLIEGITTKDGQDGFANEEGLLMHLPLNIVATAMCGHGIVGNVILLSTDSMGDSASVTDGYIAELRKDVIVEADTYTVAELLREVELSEAL